MEKRGFIIIQSAVMQFKLNWYKMQNVQTRTIIASKGIIRDNMTNFFLIDCFLSKE